MLISKCAGKCSFLFCFLKKNWFYFLFKYLVEFITETIWGFVFQGAFNSKFHSFNKYRITQVIFSWDNCSFMCFSRKRSISPNPKLICVDLFIRFKLKACGVCSDIPFVIAEISNLCLSISLVVWLDNGIFKNFAGNPEGRCRLQVSTCLLCVDCDSKVSSVLKAFAVLFRSVPHMLYPVISQGPGWCLPCSSVGKAFGMLLGSDLHMQPLGWA